MSPPTLIQQDSDRKASLTVSRQKAAELLGTSDASVQFLLESGYLPDLDVSRLLTMANYPLLYTDGDYPVLQQALASAIEPEPISIAPRSVRASSTPTPNACSPTRRMDQFP